MSISLDYLPRKDSELFMWTTNFTTVVAANASAWGIPSNEVSNLQNANNAFGLLLTKADSPEKTPYIIAQKNTARETLENIIRELVGFRLRNPIITDAQRVLLGLHVHDTTRTPVPVPTTHPEFNIEVFDVRRLKVAFHDMGSKSKAKPYGANGAVIVYAVLDTPPADVSFLAHSTLATRTPHTLEFTEEERGKKVYVAICWQNEKGQRGPWSAIQNTVIP
jgi:hypothetical protein